MWVQVWNDEFDGPAGTRVDTTRWRYDMGDGCPGVCGWGNNEKEFYTSDTANIALNGQGQLAITARVVEQNNTAIAPLLFHPLQDYICSGPGPILGIDVFENDEITEVLRELQWRKFADF